MPRRGLPTVTVHSAHTMSSSNRHESNIDARDVNVRIQQQSQWCKLGEEPQDCSEAHQEDAYGQQRGIVLSILLNQPQFCQQQTVICKLLSTNRQLREAVTVQCRGTLSVKFDATDDQQQYVHFARWLQQHAPLLQHLQWRCGAAPDTQQAAEAAVEAALHQAAATAAAAAAVSAPGAGVPATLAGKFTGTHHTHAHQATAAAAEDSIRASVPHFTEHSGRRGPDTSTVALPGLQSYACSSAGFAAGRILTLLPASRLTRLDLQFTQAARDDAPLSTALSAAGLQVQQFQAALGRLVGLHSLNLHTRWFPVDDLVLSAGSSSSSSSSGDTMQGGSACVAACGDHDHGDSCLSGLVTLTHLAIGKLSQPDRLSCLPGQLLQLQLHLAESDGAVQVHLGCLTALTHLTLAGGFSGFSWHGDALPPNLLELQLVGCDRVVGPLLQLQQLRRLTVQHSRTPAAQLCQVSSSCTALQHVELGYKSAAAADAAAAGWPALPLKGLDINTHFGLGAATFTTLGKLTSLTRLVIRSMPLNPHKTTPKEFALQLQQLTALKELQLVRFDFQKEQQHEQSQEQRDSELLEQHQRQQLYQQLNRHLRELHIQRQQQQQQQQQQQHRSTGLPQPNQESRAQEPPVTAAASAAAAAPAGTPLLQKPDMLELVRVVAGLQQLHSLELKRIRPGNAAAELSAATHIRHIRLEDCGVIDPRAKDIVRMLNASA